MNINKWIKVLKQHGEIILNDYLMNKLSNPDNEGRIISERTEKHIKVSTNELYNNNMYYGKQLNIKFKSKKEL